MNESKNVEEVALIDILITIANLYSYPNAKSSFNKCARTSALLQKHLHQLGIPSKRPMGLFIPDTDQKSWDPRWLKQGNKPPYTHYWVEGGGKILDPTAAQFGGPPLLIANIDDSRFIDRISAIYVGERYEVGTKKIKNMLCAIHAKNGITKKATHTTIRSDGVQVYYCKQHTQDVAAPDQKIKTVWRIPKNL